MSELPPNISPDLEQVLTHLMDRQDEFEKELDQLAERIEELEAKFRHFEEDD